MDKKSKEETGQEANRDRVSGTELKGTRNQTSEGCVFEEIVSFKNLKVHRCREPVYVVTAHLCAGHI